MIKSIKGKKSQKIIFNIEKIHIDAFVLFSIRKVIISSQIIEWINASE